MDPSLSVSGNNIGTGTRSSRHAVGEAAALMALQELPIKSSAAGSSSSNLDVCVSSQVGTDPITMETWEAELRRVEGILKSGQGAQLFSAEFSKVPDVERLADWLATKWAPAVLRTYDIAAIRVGARPVYASRTGEGKVEIVWQQLLDNFESVTVGRMVIQVSNDGLVATRAAGDATKGYGDISKKPLNGESVLVRRLVDAASQAVEKGLAVKVRLDFTKDVCSLQYIYSPRSDANLFVSVKGRGCQETKDGKEKDGGSSPRHICASLWHCSRGRSGSRSRSSYSRSSSIIGTCPRNPKTEGKSKNRGRKEWRIMAVTVNLVHLLLL
jgi:hypothetical protein